MPEGDSVAGDAARLRPILVGEVVESVDATSGSVRANAGRIRGHTATGIRTRGKNLVVDFDSGYSLAGASGYERAGSCTSSRKVFLSCCPKFTI